MRINNNINSMVAQRFLQATDNAMSKNLEKLSTGSRINRAADDAAGLAISEKMRQQIGTINQGIRNAQDGISLVQTMEGALNEVHAILQRVNELETQKANGTYDTTAQGYIDDEIGELTAQIADIASDTKFNGIAVFGSNDVSIKVGEGTITIKAVNLQSTDDIDKISEYRAALGATQNRLEFAANNLAVSMENLQAAESRIRDVDMAKEMAAFTKNQILSQAGVAMLAQANQKPQAVLKLLG